MAASKAVCLYAMDQWDHSVMASDQSRQSWSIRNHLQQWVAGFQHSLRAFLAGKKSQLTLTTPQKFGTGFDSNRPRGGLVRGKDGAFYGAASVMRGRIGFVFKIAPWRLLKATALLAGWKCPRDFN